MDEAQINEYFGLIDEVEDLVSVDEDGDLEAINTIEEQTVQVCEQVFRDVNKVI